MITALLLVVLAAPSQTPWLERDGETIRVSFDLRTLFDPPLRRRLQSGLSTTLRLHCRLQRLTDETTVGTAWRIARVRWDLWDEQLSAAIDTPQGAKVSVFTSLDAFITTFAKVEGEIVAAGVAEDQQVYRARVRLEVNPVSAQQMAWIRRWLSDSAESAALDPLGSGLLGNFVRLFDNLKLGEAERTIQVDGRPVRADRLPYANQESPDPPPAKE